MGEKLVYVDGAIKDDYVPPKEIQEKIEKIRREEEKKRELNKKIRDYANGNK